MNETLKQLSDDVAKELKAKFAGAEFVEFIAKVKAGGDDRTFEVVMSTSDEDRQGDSLDQSGWDFTYFKLNPVVLWAHNYSDFPIGIVTDIRVEGDKTITTGKFAPEGLNPTADIACALYQQGILKTVSPGYIQNDDGTRELLEQSFCSVPAGRFALSLRQVQSVGLSTRELVTKGFFYTTKGAVPYADHGKADPDTSWDGPAEVKACGDDLDKLKAICAWFDSENADVKSAYKLPHHEANGLKAVWKGVSAAGAAISGARGGVDIPEGDLAAVRSHLAKHYKAFGKTPPWEKKAADDPVIGDTCELDDGTPGVLAEDPKNPGRLVCVPPEEGKSKSKTQMNDELQKKLKAEHERHGASVVKAIEEFGKALPEKKAEDGKEGSDNSEMEKAIDEFTEKMDGEHEDHLAKCMKAIDETWSLEDQHDGKALAEKAIDEFKKAVEDEHLKHVKTFHKAIEEFKEATDGDPDKCEKAIEEFTTKAEDELSRHEKAHMDMCKAEFGEGQDDGKDEKAVKSGRAISAANKAKIDAVIKAIEEFKTQHAADHEEFTNKVIAALKDLQGPEPGEGKENQDEKSGAPKARSATSSAATNGNLSELDAYLFAQQLMRKVNLATRDGLRQINEDIRKKFPSVRTR